MPDAKHSPAPWEWRKFGTWALVSDKGRRRVVLATGTNTNGDSTLLMRRLDGLLYDFDPNSPDARLIAEAPAMFAAMQLFLATVSRDDLMIDWATTDTLGYEQMEAIVARINEPATTETPRAS